MPPKTRSQTAKKAGKAKKKEGDKEEKRRKEICSVYIYKLLKQIHPNLEITTELMRLMKDIFERIVSEASRLSHCNKQSVVTRREIQTAVRPVLPELAKQATSEGTKAVAKVMCAKRKDYISWEDYFMGVALLAAQRSKDPSRQVGACIVNEENKIVGVGYNGFPKHCSDDEFPWEKGTDLNNKHLYVCHAELNAILNAFSSTKDCRLYVTLFPCSNCAKCIIQSGIREVIFMEYWKIGIERKASERMFSSSEVRTRLFNPGQEKIVLTLRKPAKRTADDDLSNDKD